MRAHVSRNRSKGSFRPRFVIAGVVVLAVLGVAVFTVVNRSPSAGAPTTKPTSHEANASQHPKPQQGPLDLTAVWSRLDVLRPRHDGQGRWVVALGRPAESADAPNYDAASRRDMLPREMVRQAVLIAARDQLGASTRDELIEAAPVRQPEGESGRVEVISFIRDNRSREQIRRVRKERDETLFKHETPTTPGKTLDLLELLKSAEVLSREQFPGILKSLGLEGKENAFKADAGLPEKVEARLASLDFLDALLAVRDVHAAMRADGESPARLGALARGYALLGLLSEFEWHPAHRAFKARGLLYAQRLIAHQPGGPTGLRHRAFGLALVGRHRDALADLEMAKKAETKDSAPAPEWLDLVDAYSHYDVQRLARAGGSQAKLARLLRAVALEVPFSTVAGLKAAEEVVLLQPYCFRAHDLMCEYAGVANQHATNMMGPQALEKFLSAELGRLDALPGTVREQLQATPGFARAAELIETEGTPAIDMGEPSWGVIAQMIRETRFVQVFRHLNFFATMLAAPADEYWKQVRDDVASHRYRPYLEILALPEQSWAESFRQFGDQIDLADIEPRAAPMIRSLAVQGRPRSKNAWNVALAHADETAEMAVPLCQTDEATKVEMARDILSSSPYQPYARAVLIDKAWDYVKEKVPEWEKESGDTPALLAALARRYTDAKQYEDAERILSHYIDLSPDGGAFRLSASTYKAQGKIDRWRETLEASLKAEDFGLDHARARVAIADYYMEQKQWDKARPYAEQAAATWAEWAMNCAARCAEGEKDWARAEEWYRRETARYPGTSWAVWYFFCKRTGQGDLAAARASVDQYLANTAAQISIQNEEFAGCFHWLEGQLEKAKSEFASAYSARTSVSAAICLAMILDDEKNVAKRNEMMGELVAKHGDKAPKSIAICRLFLDSVLAPDGTKKALDLAALDGLISSIPEENRGNAEFFGAWFLKNHNHPDEAKKYFRHCTGSRNTMNWYWFLANDALKRGSG